MFNYYGSKSKIAKKYPDPIYDTIIEPFAGSAQYSIIHPHRRVKLYDIDLNVYRAWKFMLNCSIDEIDSIPNIIKGTDLRNYEMSKGMKCFLSYLINRGRSCSANVCTEWAADGNVIWSKIDELKRYKRKYFHNWSIRCLDYRKIPNRKATWFIDPPYVNGGEGYKHSDIDYKRLANWCKSRKGQVIVCENGDADWLPFRKFVETYGVRRTTTELIWTNH